MNENPLTRIATFGQSIWLDYIRRHLLSSGELGRLIEEDGLGGVTSNPNIFEKAITGSHDYDDGIRGLALEGRSVQETYEGLVVEDIQGACDLFRPVFDRAEGRCGFVSLEVSPHLAHDTRATVSEARRLWSKVDRPNVLIKVPGTREGLPAIRQLIREGINVNVTLLFGLPRYREVAEAYLAGLEARLADGNPIDHVVSVASFFLSRIDVLLDPILQQRAAEGGEPAKRAGGLRGQVAVASAKVAYQIYKEVFGTSRFQKLASRGARTQRLLWASTSTKNPEYSDVKYVEALIGPETVNTVPLETLNAYRHHGDAASRLEEGTKEAEDVFARLPELGINIDQVTQQLEDEGVDKFIDAFDRLIDAIKQKSAAAEREPVDRQVLELVEYDLRVSERLVELEDGQFPRRLWRRDAGLWRADRESQLAIHNALGWLHLAEKMEQRHDELQDFAAEVKRAGFRRVIYMGMGGSSLAPLVFQQSFEPREGGLPLTVLDSTDPATILAVGRKIGLKDTLFIVASKSGTTAEVRALEEYFYDKLKGLKGQRAGENFVAVTDFGSPLAELASERHYRRVFLDVPHVGGRYSALSYVGLLPAALMGLDVEELLLRSLRMVHACSPCVPVDKNPGVELGVVLGELAAQGRDKVTFFLSKDIAALGMWLEQLLAESTGKDNTGLIPVVGEPLGGLEVYGDDRLFVTIRLQNDQKRASDARLATLRDAGHPVVTIRMEDPLDLGQEFFRWEIATATAGAILGVNPFDQPDVQESKDATNRLLERLQEEGHLPEEEPAVVQGHLQIYGPRGTHDVAGTLARLFAEAHPGDYVALLAYLTEQPRIDQALGELRRELRDRLHLATMVGYGPRLLHSIGQLHKGGPDTGLFLQLTTDDEEDVPIPGRNYAFAAMKRAAALGDLEALRKRGRRVLRIHLARGAAEGLAALRAALEQIPLAATMAKA
jgi:transaldolase/glucose-6-phosphate isomerase